MLASRGQTSMKSRVKTRENSTSNTLKHSWTRLRRPTVRKLVISVAIASAIVVGIIANNSQISNYQAQAIKNSKSVAIDSIQKLIERKEGRLQTIEFGIIGLYKGSTTVGPDQFKTFVSEIMKPTNYVDYVLVVDKDTIIQAYPDTSLVGHY